MANGFEVDDEYGGQLQIDREIADVAARQHGVVARRQLLALALSARAIDRRLAAGRLHAIHRGVYSVGHPLLSSNGRWMAAVLASGSDAVLSHRSAAALHSIRQSSRPRIEITVPRCLPQRPGIELHFGVIPDDEVTELDGIPVTTVPRTLLDLATILPRRDIERALNEAEAKRLTDPLSLKDLIARHPHRPGVARARQALNDLSRGSTVTKKELEELFLRFLDRYRLPRPLINTHFTIRNHLIEADCAWPASKLMVELDSHAFHTTPLAFERDRVRDRILKLDKWDVIRVTWRQLHDDPHELAADLRELLRVG